MSEREAAIRPVAHEHVWGAWLSSPGMCGGDPYRECECGDTQFWDEVTPDRRGGDGAA